MISKSKISQAIIFCGGEGKRLGKLAQNTPKPLMIVNGKPFLFYLLKKLEQHQIKNVVLLTGHMDKKFDLFIKNYSNEFGLEISKNFLPAEFETFLRFKNIIKSLEEKFLILYGDNYWDGNFNEHLDKIKNFSLITTVYKTKGREKGNFLLDKGSLPLNYSKNKSSYMHLDMGFMVGKKEPLVKIINNQSKNIKFSDAIFNELIRTKQLGIVETDIRHRSIGTPAGLKNTRRYLRSKKIIFLDRDGVLNIKPAKADYVKNVHEFIWKPGSIDALRLLKKYGYKVIIISNQPGIARGKMKLKDLNMINNKINQDIKKFNFIIKDFFYCLHDWDEGCDCRKPNPGLFIKAQDKYFIQLSNHYFIGDDDRDMEAGIKVYLKNVKLNDDETLIQKLKEIKL